MKIQKFAMLSMMLCSVTMLQAQDVIVKHDGSTILSKVIKIGTTEVEYKKFSNQNGPTYTILKSDIQAINYENGDKDSFNDVKQQAKEETSGKQQIVVATPASDNAEIISRYNRTYEHGKAIKDNPKKKAEAGFCIMGIDENSVLSTEDITIEFCQEPYITGYKTLGVIYGLMWNYFVQIHNKTDNIIYLDLGSTFRIMKDGTSKVYYDNSQTTINRGSGSGASVNLGAIAGAIGIGGGLGTLANGVSVGGGNTSSTSKVYAKQRIIAIPPHGKMPLEKYMMERTQNKNGEIVFYGESIKYGYKNGEMPNVNLGEKYIYHEDESPYHVNYVITYSKDTEFKTVYVAKASTYMRELIGDKPWFGKYWDVTWWSQVDDPQKEIEKMRERIPEYNEYTIVGTFGYAKNALEK